MNGVKKKVCNSDNNGILKKFLIYFGHYSFSIFDKIHFTI